MSIYTRLFQRLNDEINCIEVKQRRVVGIFLSQEENFDISSNFIIYENISVQLRLCHSILVPRELDLS